MNKIVKISFLLFTLVGMIGVSVASARPTPVPTSTSEAVQDARITNLENNDTIQNANNSKQQSQILDLAEFSILLQQRVSNLENSITSLISRITNLENDPYPAVYSADFNYVQHIPFETKTEVNNLTINLTKDAVVYIESNGNLFNWQPYALATLEIDGIQTVLPDYYGQYTTGFQASTTRYLTAGQHKIKIYATMDSIGSDGGAIAEITAIAYDKTKGNIQTLNTKPINLVKENNKIKITR